jgi:hypothetical protein
VLAMPEPTYVPILTALGITGVFVGVLTLLYPVVVVGALVAIGGLMAWLRPKEIA